MYIYSNQSVCYLCIIKQHVPLPWLAQHSVYCSSGPAEVWLRARGRESCLAAEDTHIRQNISGHIIAPVNFALCRTTWHDCLVYNTVSLTGICRRWLTLLAELLFFLGGGGLYLGGPLKHKNTHSCESRKYETCCVAFHLMDQFGHNTQSKHSDMKNK